VAFFFSIVLEDTLAAVDSSALPAVEGGFGAISMRSRTSKRATKRQVGVTFIILVDTTGLLVHRQSVRQTIKVCTEVEEWWIGDEVRSELTHDPRKPDIAL
jgi:hypothetical protein